MEKRTSKKKSLQLISLFLLFIILAGIYFILTGNDATQVEKISASHLDLDSITELSYDYENKTNNFMKSGGVWVLGSDHDFPLNQKQINGMAYVVSDIEAVRLVGTGPNIYSNFGLDEPVIRIRIKNLHGGITTYLLHPYDLESNQYYFSVEGSEKVYLIQSTLYNWFSKELYELLEDESIQKPSIEEVTSFSIDSTDTRPLEMVYFEDAEGLSYLEDHHWFIKEEGDQYIVGDAEQVNNLLKDIIFLEPESYIDYHITEAELSGYGLDKPRWAFIVNASKPYSIYIGKEYGGDSYYAMRTGSRRAFLIRNSKIRQITEASAMTIMPEKICQMDVATVNKIEVIFAGNLYNMSINRENEKITCYLNDRIADEDKFIQLFNSITNLNREGQIEDMNIQDGEPYIKIVFYRNTKDYSEMTLNIYEYDSNFYRVEFDGVNGILTGKLDIKKVVDDINSLN